MHDHAGHEAIDAQRCNRCGAVVECDDDELLTLREIMERYKVGRTKALDLRRAVRRRWPDAVLCHARCVRVRASALERLWRRA